MKTETKQEKHTPGLNDKVGWDVEKYGDIPNQYFEVWGRDKICTIKPFPTDFAFRECEANARLIAASPTMFEYVIMKALEGDKDAEKIARSAGWEAKGHVGKGE